MPFTPPDVWKDTTSLKGVPNIYAVVTQYGGVPVKRWKVEYYENGNLVEVAEFNKQRDFFLYLWEVGGYDFLVDEDGRDKGSPVDYNYDNLKFKRGN